MDWNDLRLFVLAARHGGLSAGARAAGVSPPTLARRLQALEAELGRPLFERLASGYVLTEAGRELLVQAEPVETAMLAVERWRERGMEGRVVRVSAGSFTSRFLAQHVAELIGPGDRFRLQFLPADERLDIGRRAADIGVRNRRPEEAWLAGRRLGVIAFAIYARSDAAGRPFIATLSGIVPTAIWLRARRGAEIGIETSSTRSVLDLARAGAGRALLPCFVGDGEPGLVRLEGPIAELDEEQWLVMHHAERHDPAVRVMARRIVRLLQANAPAFLGRTAPAVEPPG